MSTRGRHSTRLKSWDYSSNGFYFVTICSYKRECKFGEIYNSLMLLNENGQILDDVWNSLPNRFPVGLDIFQIMPNHVHFVIIVRRGFIHETQIHHARNRDWMKIAKSHTHMGLIKGKGLMNQTPTKIITLGHVVRYFKAKTSFEIHKMGINQGIWQRNYHDRIIRNEQELEKIRQYIASNPGNWDSDKNNPVNVALN